MKFYKDGLDKSQIEILKKLSPLMQKNNFYLAGGTALAIYFGHRISVDLDWFSPKPFGDALLLAKKIQNEKIDLKVEETSLGTLHGSIANVRVTFLEYQYPLLSKTVLWEETGCILASLEDLACMKLSAIAQRGARKDFCDIYALGKTFSLQEMLTFYSKKFKIQNISHVLYGLSYFDDAEQERMPKMLWDVSWKEIKKTIQEWVKQLAS
jgi:predicted nucleotidyltransferase component of viral defense system